MSFNIALSGLNAVSDQLGTISNNIANAGTTGFKSSRTNFGSVYADSQALGVEVLGKTQSISQNGTLVATGRTLDLAISGGGFFTTKGTNGEQAYTRAGVFNTDKDNYLVSAAGHRLQGYPIDAAGTLQTGAIGDLQVQTANLPAKATDSLKFIANLDADQEVPGVTPMDPANVDSYNFTYTSKVYDSVGREHAVTQYFVKTAENTWDVHYQAGGATQTANLQFGTDGQLVAGHDQAFTFNPPGANPITMAIDYSGTSQYGSDFVVTSNRANGYTAGEQTGLAVEKDGRVFATYSNGQRMVQGQLVLANFVNLQGLRNESGTMWTATEESGAPLMDIPGAGQNGSIASGSLENSNVDLTRELVGLMESQRNYQANTKVLSTDKELAQLLFNAI
ncbi:flagellar hook protein FlgE [Halopseudomonas xinjiangensis]|uniref:Flagellar hook protein FlgE n=1 Tax=Halopseudomonas xinjiangensis TaxID=487184 RepID=A0A1H1YSB1_9GAMM|nr:flagellar hook protein FlgE [Halopseudomonas xinjiangensis]SDT24212.1 flagellar hook protein FlgE [Halopseudomonas xinjiangensis]